MEDHNKMNTLQCSPLYDLKNEKNLEFSAQLLLMLYGKYS